MWSSDVIEHEKCSAPEENVDFPQLGIYLMVLEPRQPMSMYHYEVDQEDFLVLAGEALLRRERTRDADEAYAAFPGLGPTRYNDGWLP